MLTRHGTGLIALGVLGLVLVLLGPLFLDRFTLNVLTRSMIYAMMAITVDLLWGYAGILTFGQSAFFGAGAYATALILTHVGGGAQNFALALVLSLVLPMGLAALVGWLSFYHKSTPLYASVISLVVPIVLTQAIFAGGSFTGSSSGLVGYPTMKLGAANYFRLAGVALILFAALSWVIVRSDAGRLLVAIRDNPLRAAYLGIRTQRVQILLMTALGGVAGIAGFLYANAGRIVAPEIAGFGFGTQMIVWTALGGRGTILGPAMGAIGIDYLGAQLSGAMPYLWQLIIGILFVVMILFMPRGLAGFIPRRRGGAPVPQLGALPDHMQQRDSAPLLSVSGMRKSYGDFVVLDGIDLEVRPGELVSVVGPNGAGKTTFLRCLSDGTETIEGRVLLSGQDIAGRPPEAVVALGVGRKFQVASVFETMTVAECLRLARVTQERPSLWRRAARITLPRAVLDILSLTGLDGKLSEPVSGLSHGMRQSLELAMVVAMQPRLILLDEPTAGLTKAERTLIGEVLIRLTRDLGYAAVLIEHDLDFVRQISKRIVVLHQGRLVMDGPVDAVVNSDLVRSIYSGVAHD
nr:branched-chain amino acid ABC transporter ATP-binding protein/permease [Paracoccus shandongensis]